VSRYQKGKTNLDLLEQEIVSSSGISWATRKSAPHPRQITTPATHHSVLTDQMPFLLPNQQRESFTVKILLVMGFVLSFFKVLDMSWPIPIFHILEAPRDQGRRGLEATSLLYNVLFFTYLISFSITPLSILLVARLHLFQWNFFCAVRCACWFSAVGHFVFC